ncbi:MAG: O-antigen ligase like rane protein, partial [Tardiphaga sp.]|uniref:O-antigen ligase family protein n=1 Tax=Tardiphaga sp. TaxID=1926292 RepID=UPI00260E7C92
VVWHVWHGHIIVWKQLGDPKSAFLFLPMCIGVGLVIGALPANRFWISIWCVLFVLIVMSAERKALVPFLAVTLAVFLNVRNIGALVLAAAAGMLAIVVADAITGGQISQRVGSIFVEQDRNEIWYAIEGGLPSSISDTARKLGSDVAWTMFFQNPFLGAGTDATGNFARTYFANYPPYLRAAVHNEFLRMLAENGLLGAGIVFTALARSMILSVRDAIWMRRRFGDYSYIRALLILFIPVLTYMWYEGSGTEMFVVIVLITLVPDLLPQIVTRVRVDNELRAASIRRRGHFSVSRNRRYQYAN